MEAARSIINMLSSRISPVIGATQLGAARSKPGVENVPQNAQYYYTEEEKEKFRKDPEFHLQYRCDLEQTISGGFDVFIRDSTMAKKAEEMMRAEMIRRIGPGHEELKEKLIPSWPPGCASVTHFHFCSIADIGLDRSKTDSWGWIFRGAGPAKHVPEYAFSRCWLTTGRCYYRSPRDRKDCPRRPHWGRWDLI